MAEQSYESHVYHPVPAYIATGMTVLALFLLYAHRHLGWHTEELAFTALALAVFVLVTISRGDTVALQDRIIMLEMKVRCAELLSAGQDVHLAKLSKSSGRCWSGRRARTCRRKTSRRRSGPGVRIRIAPRRRR